MTAAHSAEAALFDLLVDRLTGAGLTAAATDVVLAAAEGDDELAAAVDGAVGLRATARPRPLTGDVPGVYLRSVAVQGFRGIGDRAVVNLRPGPGLTLVTG